MTDDTSVINPQASVYLEKKTLMKQKKLNDRNHVMKRQRVIHCRSIFYAASLDTGAEKGII